MTNDTLELWLQVTERGVIGGGENLWAQEPASPGKGVTAGQGLKSYLLTHVFPISALFWVVFPFKYLSLWMASEFKGS